MNSVSSEAGNNNNTNKIRFYKKSAFVGLTWVLLSVTEPVSPCPRQDNGSLSLANGSKVEKERESVCFVTRVTATCLLFPVHSLVDWIHIFT